MNRPIPNRIIIPHPVAFERWFYDTPNVRGIGNSETAQIELAWRFARRGWEVINYAPIPDGTPTEWRGTRWYPLEEIDFSLDGHWLIFRSPEMLDQFPLDHPGKRLYLVSQDESYGKRWNDERCQKLDLMFALCRAHRDSIESDHPLLAGKVAISSNGLKLDQMREAEIAWGSRPRLKYCFDWDGSLSSNESLRDHARKVWAAGHEVHLIPELAAGHEYPWAEQCKALKVPFTAIHRVNDGGSPEETAAAKAALLKELGAYAFYDDLRPNLQAAYDAGIRCCVQIDPSTFISEDIPVGPPRRNPHRIMWASSPDRGLLTLLRIFRRVRQWVSDAELVATYGFNNIDKLIETHGLNHFTRIKEEILKEADQPGVKWLGRLPQPGLWEEWAKSGLIVYPSLFRETSCATIMEAQALGAVPIVSPVWALAENHVGVGSWVHGIPDEETMQARFVTEIYRWMTMGEPAEQARPLMMQAARNRFNWERAVDTYEAHLLGFATRRMSNYQFAFQLKHATGKVLNVGCADDPAEFGANGGVNMDLRTEDPIFHRPTKAQIIGDCRDLPAVLHGQRFDTVLMGDILEHFPVREVPSILRRAAVSLLPGGKVVFTVPDDPRPAGAQHAGSDGSDLYAKGVSACHTHRIPRETIALWLAEAGLIPELVQPLEYNDHGGWGVSARPDPQWVRCVACGAKTGRNRLIYGEHIYCGKCGVAQVDKDRDQAAREARA